MIVLHPIKLLALSRVTLTPEKPPVTSLTQLLKRYRGYCGSITPSLLIGHVIASVCHERKSSRARALVVFGPLKILSWIGQRIGCQWKRLVNAGGDGYRNMNSSKYPEEETV